MFIIKKRKKKKFISFITVTKNSEKTLNRCIKSVKNQKRRNFEHLIIDGKSTDKTIDIIKNNQKYINIAISKKDKNMWEAINLGIKNSNGQVICIVNSDDVLYKNASKIIESYFKKNSIDYLLGSVKKKKIYKGFRPDKINYKFNIFPSHSLGLVVKKKLHDEIGYYNTNLRFCADYDFLYKIVKKNYKWKATKKSEVLGKFYKGGISENLNIFEKIYYESLVRLNNKQSTIYVFVLAILHFLNFIKNKITK
jgi:glycosyltransferase involved in cell wall biosynthesis